MLYGAKPARREAVPTLFAAILQTALSHNEDRHMLTPGGKAAQDNLQ
jgi:hypothetical protein